MNGSEAHEFSNTNGAEVVELEDDPVKCMERNMNELKMDHQFKEENVSQFFRTVVNEQIDCLVIILIDFHNHSCTMDIGDIEIRLEKMENNWLIIYNDGEKTIKSDDPEKSIVDHLWFVLNHPKIDLGFMSIHNFSHSETENGLMDRDKFELLFQSMLDSIDHQMPVSRIFLRGFNEDTFTLMLQHIKPKVLEAIDLDISWKQRGNVEKIREIVRMDQWKQAKEVNSWGVIPLKIEDVCHCESFKLSWKSITPVDVRHVIEHFSNSTATAKCVLDSKESVDLNKIEKVLPSNSRKEERINEFLGKQTVYTFQMPNSQNYLTVEISEKSVRVSKNL